MKIRETPLAGLALIETAPIQDERGRFERLFCAAELATWRPDLHFCQINLSTTLQRGSVRGMHFQHPPAAETKLIRCLHGRVFDVAVDLRAGSPTFLQWFGIELSDENSLQMLIPEGFAHGFQSLADNAQLLYMHTAAWSRPHEGGLRPDDPQLAIEWPLPVDHLSARDRTSPLLDERFTGIHL
jgi:dTDP-4-dehydrorhamnose 3,5-epimerase